MNGLNKIKQILRQKKGETLMEGIISVLVFSIMIAAITMMINWALRFNAMSTTDAETMQNAANDLFGGAGFTVDATLVLRDSGNNVVASIPIRTTDGDSEFFAFVP
jgi:hypothetical protein